MSAATSPLHLPAIDSNGHTMTLHATGAITNDHAGDVTRRRPQPTAPVRPVSFARLLRVEGRKLLDTRAGRALLGTCALISVVTVWGAIVWLPDPGMEGVVMFLFELAALPVSVLVPVVAILAATTEWSQRTGQVTFALEPRRARVVAAKVVVSCAAGALAVAVALAVVLGCLGLAALLGDTPASWSLDGARLAGSTLIVVLTMLQAATFGFALLNTAAAIVSFFVLPTITTVATSLSTRLAEHAEWFDIGVAGAPFLSGTATGTDWAHLASACLPWIVAPMAIGVVRVLRSDLT